MADRRMPPGVPESQGSPAIPDVPTQETTPTDLMDGRYRIERVIGQGASGRVYLAFDTRLRHAVAIKELLASRNRSDAATYARYLERFQREARAARWTQHPNIVTVYDLAIDHNGNHYLIMEYVDGTSLRDLLAQIGTLPVERAVAIATEVARALDAVHEQDIVHRDLKPANIMLTRRGMTKVTDFGIAQVGDESQRTEMSVGHPGTPIYMSPEQRRETGYLDGRSDLYTLGLVLYEMLVGEPYAHRREPLSIARPDLPPPLVAVVERLMAREPDARYQSASAVVEALTRLSGTLPDIAADVPAFRPPGGAATAPDGPTEQQFRGPRAAPPPGVPAVYGGVESAPPGLPATAPGAGAPVQPWLPVDTRQATRRGPGLWAAIGGGVAAILVAVVVAVMLAGHANPPATATPAVATVAPQSSGVATPSGGAATPASASAMFAGSPVPENAYVVADAKNLLTYAYPRDWKAGGVTNLDVDVVAGYTVFSPFAIASIAKEDVTASTTLDAYTDDYIARRFRKSLDWKPGPISKRNAQIAGQDARIVDFLQPNTQGNQLAPKGGTIYQYVLLTLHDSRAWIIGYAVAIDQKDAFQTQFDVLVRTFGFCAPGGCARQQTVPTVAPGQTTQWADPARQMTAAYPADWLTYPDDKLQGDALRISSPDGTFLTVSIVDQRGTLDEEVKLVLDTLASNADYTFITSPTADLTIGGEPGKSVGYTYLPKNDPTAKARNGAFWIVNRGGKEFSFQATDLKAHRADVDAFIGAVAFTGPAAPTPTPVPTRPPPTATAARPTRPPTPVGGYGADFAKWPTDEKAGSYRRGYDAPTDGYRIALLADDSNWYFYTPETQNVADFTLDVDVRQVAGPDAGQYGVTLRVQPQDPNNKGRDLYFFYIDSQGHFGFNRLNPDNTTTVVQSLTAAPAGALKPGVGSVNHLTVMCKGDKINITVNSKFLATVTASLQKSGNVGVMIGAPPTIKGVEVVYTNLRVTPL